MSPGRPSAHPDRKVSDFEWLERQLRKILDWGDEASRTHPSVYHEYGVHTALKLAALNHALDVFTPIARRQSNSRQGYRRSVYVDLFSGCGATRTPRGDWLAGSPLLAVHAKAPFDKLILVEQAQGRFEALTERVNVATAGHNERIEVLQGNCNSRKDDVVRSLRPDDLVFISIDPEGMEVQWDTIQRIVDHCPASDLFVNCTNGVVRVLEEVKQDGHGTETLAGFMGLTLPELLARLENGGTVLRLYEENLAGGLDKPFGTSSPIKDSGGRTLYHILIRTRKTSGGSPYSRGYQALANRLRGVTAEHAKTAIEMIKGRQSSLGPV